MTLTKETGATYHIWHTIHTLYTHSFIKLHANLITVLKKNSGVQKSETTFF